MMMNNMVMVDQYLFVGLWCFILSTYIFVASSRSKALRLRKNKNLQMLIYLSTSCLLILNMSTYFLIGGTSVLARWAIGAVDYLMFLLKYVYITLFVMYLLNGNCTSKRILKGAVFASALIGLAGIVCITIPGIKDCIYYYDSANHLYYGGDYQILSILVVLDLLVLVVSLMVVRKSYRRGTFCLYMGYFVSLTFLGVLDYFFDLWYLQNMAIFFSTMIISIDNMIQVTVQWSESQDQLVISEYRSKHDLMTGLWNKANGLEQMREYISHMSADDTAFLGFIDIDDFKSVNDTYGHDIGDYWICEVAKQLQILCDSDDITCRYGGDEYIVLLKHVPDVKALEGRMADMRAALRKQSLEKQQDVHCSVGFYQIRGTGHMLEECIKQADTLLYEAKKRGKNVHVVGSSGTG